MKIVIRICLTAALLAAGFAAGFPAGKSAGFDMGSEWAMVQAEIYAREAGLDMPVIYDNGQFRVILKQPRHLYRRAWRLADRYEDELAQVNQCTKGFNETIRLAGSTFAAR